jgi:hypothetical protein
MIRTVLLIIIILKSTFAQAPFPSPPFNDGNWFLEFNEEFDSLSSKHWEVKHLYNNGNYEAVMLKDNVSIENGSLVLTLKKEYKNVSNLAPHGCETGLWLKEYDFTGGWVNSKALFGYGYYEIKFKCDLAKGFFPAIWMFNRSPHYQEIDLLESNFNGIYSLQSAPCSNTNNITIFNNYYMFTSNIHFHDASSTPDEIGDDEQYPILIKNVNFLNYNILGFEWLPNRMRLYLNGVHKWTIYLPISCQILPTQQFDLPVSVIFDAHVDNFLCSCKNKNKYEEPNCPSESYTGQVNDSILPNNEQPKLYIDYFRYYRLKDGCNDINVNVNANCYNFMNHTNSIKKSYSLGPCSAYNPNSQAGQYYIFRSVQPIVLNGEFIIPSGSEYMFDAANYCQPIPSGIENCNQNFIQCNYDYSIYQNVIRNSIEIGGNNCVDYIMPSHNNIIFKARDYIHLKEGFGVLPESDFSGIILNCN